VTATLPTACYTDPEIARRERKAIFDANWALFGPEHEAARPGNYSARTVNGWPLLVLRDADGRLRGFHNVCRHRAAALAADGAGTCSKIVCPYHGWTYRLDGRLSLAPRFGEELDAEEMALLPVRVATWRGCIFVALSEHAPELDDWLGSLPGLVGAYPDTVKMDYHGSFTVDGRANWKTYCDNTVEGYHLPFVHRRLTQAVAADGVEIRAYDDHRLVCFHVTYRGSDSGLRGATGIWFYRYPGFQGVVGQTGYKAERIEPLGAGSLRSQSWAWYGPLLGSNERADAFAWAEAIVREDLGVCESVQRNLEAGAYTGGRLSPDMESHVAALQALVRADLGM
jgi:choline monooxygenase